MTVTIRVARAEDAPALSDLYAHSVRTLGPRNYSPEQVRVWASLTPDAESLQARMGDGRLRWVAVDGDELLGFVDLETDGHIDLLYVAPRSAGQGVGRALLETAEAHGRLSGSPKLWAEASDVARPLFERLGYRVLSRRDLVISDVAIHNWAVEKRL